MRVSVTAILRYRSAASARRSTSGSPALPWGCPDPIRAASRQVGGAVGVIGRARGPVDYFSAMRPPPDCDARCSRR
jgi:hypothetical protein